jgi:metallo-beta-lactamase family protein
VRLLFTGDLGRTNQVILRDPVPVPGLDYLISESTYGDRRHPPTEKIRDHLGNLILTVQQRRARLIIPAFAVGRIQSLVYYLHQLYEENRIGPVPVFVDSPLGMKATEVFVHHPECYDAEARRFLTAGDSPFAYKSLHYVSSIAESKELNDRKGPFVIIASSGMCEGGRILHHLVHGIEDPNNIVLLTGFQAQNTLGRKLHGGWKRVPILGREYEVRAKVEMLDALSAHADGDEMISFFQACNARPRRTFLVHGEPPQCQALRQRLQTGMGWTDVNIPAPGETFEL